MYIQKSKKWTTAKSQDYNGRHYDSKFEASQAIELTELQRAGRIKSFETHERIELKSNGYHICNYYIDFTVHHLDGTIEYIETKGYPTEKIGRAHV